MASKTGTRTMEQEVPLLYNSRIVLNYIRLIEKKYHYVDVNQLLEAAGMERHQVEDQGHWFSQEQINRFHTQLDELIWNKNIAREAGMFASSPESLGSARLLVLSLLSPSKACELFSRAAARFSRAATYESRKLSSQRTEITVTPKPGVEEEPFQCENRLGYLVAMARSLRLLAPAIEHPECRFRGDARCRYVVSWSSSANTFFRITVLVSAILFPAAFFFYSTRFSLHLALGHLLPWGIALLLFFAFSASRLTIHELRGALENSREVSDELYDQIEENYTMAKLVNAIGQAIGQRRCSEKDLVERVIEILEQFLPFDRGMILLPDQTGRRLLPLAWFGATPEQAKLLQELDLRLDTDVEVSISVRAFRQQRPLLVDDIRLVSSSFSRSTIDLAEQLGIRACIACPILFKGESLGVLAVDNQHTRRRLRQRDLNLLMGIAAQIGAALHGVRLEAELHNRRRSLIRLIKG